MEDRIEERSRQGTDQRKARYLRDTGDLGSLSIRVWRRRRRDLLNVAMIAVASQKTGPQYANWIDITTPDFVLGNS